MFKLVKALYESTVAEYTAKTVALQAEAAMIQEASNIVVDRPDKDGWIRQFQANDREKGMVQGNQLDMLRKAREFSRFDPYAKATLSTFVNYIMGKGLTMTPKSDDPMVWWVWREFWTSPRNKMQLKQFELVLRSLRDGELFIQFFSKDENGSNTGKTSIRFIDPLRIRAAGKKDEDSSKTINVGVNTNPNDVEEVVSYTVWALDNASQFDTVSAKDVYHIKLNVDSDQKRGETQLLSIMNALRHHEQWLENRIILNKIRSAIVLIKHVEGSPTEVQAMSKTIPANRNPSNESKIKNIRSGSVITEGPGVTYRMEGANINATDAAQDGRNIKLSMAAANNMPEYMYGDASNGNYASSMMAESPFVKAIHYWQMLFEYHWGQIYRRVIQNAVDAQLLEAPNDDEFLSKLKKIRPIQEIAAADKVPDSQNPKASPPADSTASPAATEEPEDPEQVAYEEKLKELLPNGKMEMPTEIFFGVDVQWPEIIHRDIKQQVDAMSIARQNGWLSDPTASSELGYDYSEECRKQRQVEEEAEKTPNPLLGPTNNSIDDSAGMDAEMQDTLNSLSPEDRNAVLQAKDPKEVARIMSRAQTAKPKAADEVGTQ